MEIPTFTIETKDDIQKYIGWATENNLLLYPDDSYLWILEFADDENPSCITLEQATYLDQVVAKCFDVCEQLKLDIYKLWNW